jgi:hypothetical protein
VVAKEETVRKQEAEAAQEAAGEVSDTKAAQKKTPITKDESYGRNDLVTITDGTTTQEMKFKKAEPFLAEGWTLVEQK